MRGILWRSWLTALFSSWLTSLSVWIGSGITSSRKRLSPTEWVFHLCFVVCPEQFIVTHLCYFMIVFRDTSLEMTKMPFVTWPGPCDVIVMESCTQHCAQVDRGKPVIERSHPTSAFSHRNGISHWRSVILLDYPQPDWSTGLRKVPGDRLSSGEGLRRLIHSCQRNWMSRGLVHIPQVGIMAQEEFGTEGGWWFNLKLWGLSHCDQGS